MKSLYVHIPFCQHICSYCDFSKVYYREDWAERYLTALSYEIKDKNLHNDYETIYIGGGTPSSLSLQQLHCLLEILKPFSKKVKEYTIEINPESFDEEKLKLCIDYGINRLSIGVQTFQDHLLPYIQRYHHKKMVLDCILKAQQWGIEDINIDLMYGLPHQTLQDVLQDIDIVALYQISHVSVYSLILEDHTFLKHEHYQPLDDEEDAKWYEKINDYLAKNGYSHYEVSNYYLNKPSYHNLTYWHYQDYEGIGLSAHSLKHHHRLENTKSLTQYFQYHYLEKDILLSHKDEIFEKIMMGLRLTEGISIHEMNKMTEADFLTQYHEIIQKYQKMKMLEIKQGYLRTTALGMNYLNNILVDFIEED